MSRFLNEESFREALRKADLFSVSMDFVFARLFGAETDKRVLLRFINKILSGKPNIKSIDLVPRDYKKKTKDGEPVYFDVLAKSDDGTLIQIEIQCKDTKEFTERSMFNIATLQKEALNKVGVCNDPLNIISIWICTQNITKRKGCIHEIVNTYKANGIDSVEVFSETTRQIIIELPKLNQLNKQMSEEGLEIDPELIIWLKFVIDAESVVNKMDSIAELREAMEALVYMSVDPETRDEFIALLRHQNDSRAAETEKFREGEKKGLEKGRKAEKIEFAKKMLLKGLSLSDVSEFTELSIEEVAAIKKKLR